MPLPLYYYMKLDYLKHSLHLKEKKSQICKSFKRIYVSIASTVKSFNLVTIFREHLVYISARETCPHVETVKVSCMSCQLHCNTQ